MMKYWGILFLLYSFASCTKGNLNLETAENYYQTISERKNAVILDDFLSETFSYRDVIYKQEYSNKESYINTLLSEWNDSLFSFPSQETLQIEEAVSANDSMVWVKGVYSSYAYNGKEVDAREFVSILYFDKNGKIYKQEDWLDHSLEGIIQMYQFRQSVERGF